jgi:hypothetical protein
MKQILDRVGRGQKIPFGDPSRWNNVINRWAWIKILMAFAIAYSLKNRGLVLFSTIGTIAYFLSISVFITGIEFENWHWLYVINPFLAVVIYTGLVRFLFIRQHVSIALSLTLLLFASSLYLRYQEALIAPDAIEMKNWSEGTKPMRPIVGNVTDDGDSCIAGRQAARILSLSMPGGRILFHEPHSAHTSLMSDEEVHERYVLNYWLMGGTREDLASRPANQIFKMYIFANTHPDWDREVVRSKQLAVFDRLERENGQTAMAKYQPVFLLLDKTSLDHPPVRGGHWQKVGQSRDYVLWKMVKNISSAD